MKKLFLSLILWAALAATAHAANINIDGLPAASPLAGANLFECEQSGVNHKCTAGGITQGVFNVRTMYGAVPDGSTDNATAIASAFTASNAFVSGIPTVYFDCDVGTTTCQYNFSGSGTSPINPVVTTTIQCATGVTLNYTGSAHAADIGPSGRSTPSEDRYTVQGCRWTGGATMTEGLYFNNFLINTAVLYNTFFTFGNRTGYTVYYAGNNWEPLVKGNTWWDNDGTSRNILDAHNSTSTINFTDNLFECETSSATACSISAGNLGVGVWVSGGRIFNNYLQYHSPVVRASPNSVVDVFMNHIEGNSGAPGPAITYGNPGTAGANYVGLRINQNLWFWPAASTVPYVGPETASSGSNTFGAQSQVIGNYFASTPSSAVYVNTNGGAGLTVEDNYTNSGLLTQASSPPIIDAGFATNKAYFGIHIFTNGQGSLASRVPVFDSSGINLFAAAFHNMSSPLKCSDTSGSGTAQVCATSPQVDVSGSSITPVTSDAILYTTTTTNTGALTLVMNGAAAANVVKSGNTALTAGDIVANQFYLLVFDAASHWEIMGK